ncbi:MAG: hypothetical protein J6Q77_03980, partial [Clostridia bacterium]|nr:hypothetical protein [Clostridia bacterium]
INLPVLMQGAMRSYPASGTILPEGIEAKLDEITPALIQRITVQMLSRWQGILRLVADFRFS